MSRSALWRQDANVRQREQTASDIFSRAVEEGKVRILDCVHEDMNYCVGKIILLRKFNWVSVFLKFSLAVISL